MTKTTGADTAQIYQVVRPDDGMVVPLTCTPDQLKEWQDRGYKLAADDSAQAATQEDQSDVETGGTGESAGSGDSESN